MNDHICKHEAENRKIIKELLNSMTEPIMREGEDNTVDLVIEAKPGELATLNLKVKRLQTIADIVIDMEDILSDMLEELKEKDFESFKSRMIKIKSNSYEVFSKMYKQLGGEEGKEGEFDEVDQEEVELS
jgi:predicted nucleic acid-binding OB-fold protein